MMIPLIDMRDVSYAYAEPRRRGERARPIAALDHADFAVWPGEYVALIGHNGSGKSTLARLGNALLVPTGGRVFVDGHDSRDPSTHPTIRAVVGMVFQNPDNQIVATTVVDDVAWALAARGWPRDVICARVSEALIAVGLADRRDWAPHHLSGGQRQRLAIAGLVALRPRCIIADEPTAQLDPLTRGEVVELLHRLNQAHGLAIVQVTHDLEEAALADRVVALERGRVVLNGPPSQVLGDLQRVRDLGIAIPKPLELVSRLRALGRAISPEALTIEALARELAP
jgi:energy-coupling factor transport system ATP-binding protein